MAIRNMPLYLSSESESDGEEVQNILVRRAKRNRQWVLEKSFENQQDAMDFINSENIWSFNYKNLTADGTKSYYRCIKCYLNVI